jgi:hypothetical protein
VQRVDVIVNRVKVARWVCDRGHPHPTQTGAEECETARAEGATDAELLVLMQAEVEEFNA